VKTPPELSVVIPVFNEEEVVQSCLAQVTSLLTFNGIDAEIIIVNDGSSDSTLDVLLSLRERYNFRILNLSVNSGHMAAITAGLEASTGKYIATMDADLQDPPKDLIEMFKLISQKLPNNQSKVIDVVQAFRIDRKSDSLFKRNSAGFYYKVIEKITGLKVIHHAADFRIMTREVCDKLLLLPERNRVYRLLIPKLGFNIVPYPITRAHRLAGKTKYSISKMLKLTADSIFAFSYRPLRIFSYFGFISSILFFLASMVTLCISIFLATVPGWPSLALLLLSANSFLFAGLGLLGEYVGRIYELVQARPIANWSEIDDE